MDAGDGATPVIEDAGTEPIEFEPGPVVMARLTATQYRNTLTDIFGAPLPEFTLEADTNPYLFYSIGATRTEVSAAGVDLYAQAADAIAAAVMDVPSRRVAVLGCEPAASDDVSVHAFVETYGRRLFRHRLDDELVELWLNVSRETADGDVIRGIRFALAGMLQSPRFLYRMEVGDPVPDMPGHRRFSDYEMASRLAFFLTDSGPDDALLDTAEAGELGTEADLAAHAWRLLEGPRARSAVQAFFAQYLDLERLAHVDRDPAEYPLFNPALLGAMEAEIRLLVDDIVFRQQGDIRDLFSAPRGYVNTALAELYGVEAPGASQHIFVPVEFTPETPRAGILTLGAFLTMNAHASETSPTLRGKYIRERVFCQTVPAPPDNVDLDITAQPGDPPTLRERLDQHRENPACAGCHGFIDPPGFLFEQYDSLGRFRTEENGHPINATGELDGVPLDDALDLAALLAESSQVVDCLNRQLFRHASGRLETPSERPLFAEIHAASRAAGYDFRATMVTVVSSPAFRSASVPAMEGEE